VFKQPKKVGYQRNNELDGGE